MERSRWMIRPYHVFQICVLLLVTTACASSDSSPAGETATLSWDASTGLDVAGYKVYQATASGAYGAPIALVPLDMTRYTVTDLKSGTTYFFVVPAYNSAGAESAFSNEASANIL